MQTKPDEQELEVAQLIAKGLKDVAIARALGISIVTVRRRAQRFRVKTGAGNRSEAIALAVARGWLTIEDTFVEHPEPEQQGDDE